MKRPHLTCETYEDEAGEWRLRVRARNGRILIVSSEGYTTRAGLDSALALLRTYAASAFEAALEPEPERRSALETAIEPESGTPFGPNPNVLRTEPERRSARARTGGLHPRLMPALPNAKHERFVAEYILDRNGGRAYERVGYTARGNAAEAAASRLLSDDKVAARVAELEAERAERLRITADDVVKGLHTEATNHADGTSASRVTAWSWLGKHLAMFVERRVVTIEGEIVVDLTGGPPEPPPVEDPDA